MMKRGKYALILKKYKYAAVVILIGILLLCWPAAGWFCVERPVGVYC